MKDNETVYRLRYTADNRVKSVHRSEQPRSNERRRTMIAYLVVIVGWILAAGWYVLWE